MQDQKLNSHSKLNCILACIQATQAGADEALMLDPHGFVATCNSTHFFIVRKGEVWTSSGKYCLGGITRGNWSLEIAREAGIPAFEKDFSLTDVYGADEAFVTGTFAGIVPVREVDGRQLTMPRADGRAAAAALSPSGSSATSRSSEAAVTLRIAMWSGPRNLSTAMMRSFGSRADTFVSDEPFYGAFLKTTRRRSPDARGGDRGDGLRLAQRHGVAARPGARRLADLVPEAHVAPHGGPIGYDDFAGFTHAFLIREPERMIASYLRKREAAAFEDFGLERQAEFFEREADRLGRAPPVIDANDVLDRPGGVLSQLCAALGIAWDPAMLSWAPGRRDTDGPWAPHWYGAVEAAPASARPRPAGRATRRCAAALADACRPFTSGWPAHRITA